MGLLSLGEPLNHLETKKYAEHVRRHGIKQFINIYNKNKNRIDRCFKWGDEIEYMVVKFDHKYKKSRLVLRTDQLLAAMSEREKREGSGRQVLWTPEYGSYMIEATPGQPYGQLNTENNDNNTNASDTTNRMSHLFNNVEENMKLRRREMRQLLNEDEKLMCITSYPRLGYPDSSYPYYPPDPLNSTTRSIFVSDMLTNQMHPRYITTGRNIRERRGSKVISNVPIFKDKYTPDPFIEMFDDPESNRAAKVDHIFMDASLFGSGCCCLQVTLQATNMDEAMLLYDQLAPMTPVMLALSASAPIFRGYLIDRDCRYDIICDVKDDRTAEESGERPLKTTNEYRIYKSRYSTINTYLSDENGKYNDNRIVYNQKYYNEMIESGVCPLLAQHIAYVFLRDPTIVYRELLNQNLDTDTDHFENIQSTNWQSLRFKPPPLSQPSIGWRVEFRPMEIQMTDFENAAYSVFVILMTRVILHYHLNLVIPISKIDENMTIAQKRDSINRCKLWFRKDIFSKTDIKNTNNNNNNEEYIQMSLNEIINGYANVFPGLVPLMREYIDSIDLDVQTYQKIQQYIQLISDRASGRLKTTAQWIRDFVRKHNDYKQDSVITETITYDLLMAMNDIQNNDLSTEEVIKTYIF
ncbi:glutamate--cysteine ligase-like [Oppia nitens]|uniref:glutamate--cysteine ligase-like n=1 Tax=Oppia nitens TaxID=1686743 RepID=UPI0023DC3E29|nr:glutamate--cysteine ligase-like [Oppia nitens]